ncbi:MAG: hypothetical protein ACE5E5_09600 [Phycisphaerae bacterium]
MTTGNEYHRDGVLSSGRALLTRVVLLRTIRSLFWLMMLAVHMPAFFASLRLALDGEGTLGAPALYGLALSFFALKIINVRFLRWHITRRSCVAWFVVVALLHVDVVQPDRPTFVPECVSIVAMTCLFADVAKLGRKFLHAANRGSGVQRHLACVPSSTNTVWQDAFRPHCWLLVLSIRRLRAPPRTAD